MLRGRYETRENQYQMPCRPSGQDAWPRTGTPLTPKQVRMASGYFYISHFAFSVCEGFVSPFHVLIFSFGEQLETLTGVVIQDVTVKRGLST